MKTLAPANVFTHLTSLINNARLDTPHPATRRKPVAHLLQLRRGFCPAGKGQCCTCGGMSGGWGEIKGIGFTTILNP